MSHDETKTYVFSEFPLLSDRKHGKILSPRIAVTRYWHSVCISVSRGVVVIVRWLRRMGYILEIFPPFFVAAFSSKGLITHEGRLLVWGKVRRIFLSAIPPLSRYLQRHYGLTGSCQSCGASCKLLFQCPHWDTRSSLCKIYEDRPMICRLFPITPTDLRDRDLVLKQTPCGFSFAKSHEIARSEALNEDVLRSK